MTAASNPTPATTLWRGRLTEPFVSPEFPVAPFDRAVLSWNCTGTCVFELLVNGERHCMGEWSDTPRSRETDPPSPCGRGPGGGRVAVDTLVLPQSASSFRFAVHPEPGAVVTLVAVAHWLHASGLPSPAASLPSPAWGRILSVPERSQFSEPEDAGSLCSPTSVAMVLEFHGIRRPTRDIAAAVYDHAARIYGNWPFNTAAAHRLSGLESFVARGTSLGDLEAEIAAGRPVIISHKWQPGDLDGAPIPSSDGHLLVVVGFTASGDVAVNDPAGQPGSVRRVYPRRQIHATWLERASGIMYVFRA